LCDYEDAFNVRVYEELRLDLEDEMEESENESEWCMC
jgi:hypothetical protein